MPSPFWRISACVLALMGTAGIIYGALAGIKFIRVCSYVLVGLSLLCCVLGFSFRITFCGDKWEIKRWFLPAKQHVCGEIRSITFGTAAGGYTLHLERGKVHIGAHAVNGTAFRTWTEHCYQNTNNKPLPYEPPHLFHNNVKNPWTVLVVFISVGALITAMAICTTVGLSAPREIPGLTEHSVMVLSVSSTGDYAQLSSDAGRFTVPLLERAQRLEAYVGCSVLIQVEDSRDTANSGLIWSAADADGTVLFTPQEVCDFLTRLDSRNILLMWSIALLYWLLFAVSCYILNHASAHPRLAALLVKPDQRNF